jgi:hypothetical protein
MYPLPSHGTLRASIPRRSGRLMLNTSRLDVTSIQLLPVCLSMYFHSFECTAVMRRRGANEQPRIWSLVPHYVGIGRVWVVFWRRRVPPWLGITHGTSTLSFFLLEVANEKKEERRKERAANESYTTYVINDAGSTYSNAYFELNYINVFSSSPSTTSSSAKTSATGATTTISTGPGSTTTAPVQAGNGAAARVGSTGGLVLVALVGSLLLL